MCVPTLKASFSTFTTSNLEMSYLSQVKEGSSEGQWKEIGVKVEKNVPATPTTFTMKGLRPDTFYQIELRAHNDVGHSEAAQLYIHTANGGWRSVVLFERCDVVCVEGDAV